MIAHFLMRQYLCVQGCFLFQMVELGLDVTVMAIPFRDGYGFQGRIKFGGDPKEIWQQPCTHWSQMLCQTQSEVFVSTSFYCLNLWNMSVSFPVWLYMCDFNILQTDVKMVVLRVMMHCEGCASTVKRAVKRIPAIPFPPVQSNSLVMSMLLPVSPLTLSCKSSPSQTYNVVMEHLCSAP